MGDSNAMPIQTVRETLHLLGYLNARYGRPERAICYFELMTVVDAMNPTAWRTLATIQLALEKNPEAAASASNAAALAAMPTSSALRADGSRLCNTAHASSRPSPPSSTNVLRSVSPAPV